MRSKRNHRDEAVELGLTTAADRVRAARALGQRCVDLYLAAHPEVGSRRAAVEAIQRRGRRGRQPSAVAEGGVD